MTGLWARFEKTKSKGDLAVGDENPKSKAKARFFAFGSE